MSGISSQAAGSLKNKEKTFQDQRFDDDLGLNWVQFKWRNHDPQIGRFIELDPLSEKYVYNSTYAFSENKVTVHRELEGLEAEYIFQKAKEEIASAFIGAANSIDRAISYFTKSETSTVVAATPISTTSVGSSVTTNTNTNFGGNMSFLVYNNTNKGNSEPLTKTTTTVTAETKTDIRIAGVTATNKTGLSNTGVVTNETGVKANILIEGVPTTVGGSVAKNTNGQTVGKVEGTTNFPGSVVQGTVQAQYSTNGKQQSVSLGVGGQVTTGKTTTKSVFGITFGW